MVFTYINNGKDHEHLILPDTHVAYTHTHTHTHTHTQAHTHTHTQAHTHTHKHTYIHTCSTHDCHLLSLMHDQWLV